MKPVMGAENSASVTACHPCPVPIGRSVFIRVHPWFYTALPEHTKSVTGSPVFLIAAKPPATSTTL